MIQANELRIGNWAEIYDAPKIYKMENGICQVEAMTIHYMQYKGEIKLRGIPLTPEILERCSPTLSDWFCEGSFKVIEDRSDMLYGWTFKVRNASHTNEIEFGYFKYVHQLQNLYFALTGEELKINL